MHALSRRGKTSLVVLAVGLLVAGGPAADARPGQSPTVDIQSAAALAPDGRSLAVTVLASCPERWTVVEARVSMSQPEASGDGTFPLTCIGSIRSFTVTVQSASGQFELGQAQATASVLIKRGRTEQATDSQVVDVQPAVVVELADFAQLQGGGDAVVIDVTVACPVGATGQQSYVSVSQDQVVGSGSYVPTCDGQPHTFSVSVRASQGLFRAGSARALTFAFVEAGGNSFSGVDDNPIQIVA